jgi:hypothetical protein
LPIHGLAWCLLAGFVFAPYGADPSGRYFVPLAIPLALIAAAFIVKISKRSRQFASGLVALVLAYHLSGTVQSVLHFPPGITTQFDATTQIDNRYYDDLIDFLRANDERYGYTNYWVSYPMAFLSSEECLYSPRLPYHQDFRYTPRDDRYPAYSSMVRASEKVAYITTHHPELDSYLRAQFSARSIAWGEKMIGDFHVFYALSAAIHPEEIGLGDLRR